MSTKTIELGKYDVAITFREDTGVEFDVCDDMLHGDIATSNIVLALTLYFLLQEENPEFVKFIEKEKQRQIKKLTESPDEGFHYTKQ